ncbi:MULTISPECIES: YfiR family protein [unclassified Novosphingobium]|uniref:YfiR family protein n=1 Tax=unclassified Novosphingobium TaxID=2644732 RepID=UPI0025EE74CC|nr:MULTISPECIES: YfiR family protein [unclassified Novosphingobium]HQV04660.1 YfiR family protein [Novosphingobium sp.]
MKLKAVFPVLPLLALTAPPLLAMADMPLGSRSNGGSVYTGAVARTVRAMIEYTRWPSRQEPVRLCVAGAAQHAGQLDGIRLSDGRRVERRNVSASPGGIAGCNVLYLGNLSIAQQRQLTTAVRGRGVLTIAEADPGNAAEAMFALTYQPKGLSFRMNIDAISRSGLKVDPRVLRVAQGGL